MIIIGKSKSFETVRLIGESLHLPILSIINPNEVIEFNDEKKSDLNLYPTVNHLMKAIIDLILHLKWEYLFVLFQDPNRVEELIRFADYNYPKINIQFRIISSDSTNWEYLINYIKSTAYSNLIIDLDDKLINKFLDIVNINFIFLILFDDDNLNIFI